MSTCRDNVFFIFFVIFLRIDSYCEETCRRRVPLLSVTALKRTWALRGRFPGSTSQTLTRKTAVTTAVHWPRLPRPLSPFTYLTVSAPGFVHSNSVIFLCNIGRIFYFVHHQKRALASNSGIQCLSFHEHIFTVSPGIMSLRYETQCSLRFFIRTKKERKNNGVKL